VKTFGSNAQSVPNLLWSIPNLGSTASLSLQIINRNALVVTAAFINQEMTNGLAICKVL
tara:strand:- start:139 stop:315 length:177 start_codon:yes stop_codon:yes gene_type:complete